MLHDLIARLRAAFGLLVGQAYGAASRVATAAMMLLRATIGLPVTMSTHYEVECRAADGTLKWTEDFHNLVVTVGLNDLLTKYFKGASYTAAWYVGLVSSSPTIAAGDTMASHSGWTEVATYSESVRQTLTLGTAATGSIDNSASKAVFSINGTVTIGGAFLATVSTKSDTGGTLYGAGAFSGGNRAAASGDTLSVTVTLTATG